MQSVIIEQLQQSLNKMNIPYRRNEKLSVTPRFASADRAPS